ncbi:MAG: histidinol-phosphatase HisJ family protein [Candidatus Latescibacteria bacterium]|nr:histidinol-phosphatase HisJ family protein [bacterium]MBD3422992.1 histidinol-phosphatase HisJ family protein [Candidatus Latescibacterota bacterium]
MTMLDYHLHTNFCGHGKGDPSEYVRAAIDRGLDEIGFSCHLPMLNKPDPYHAMPRYMLPVYFESLRALQKEHSGSIRIKIGIEADYLEGYEDMISYLLSAFPFDYVLGSVHFLDQWHFTSRAGRDQYSEVDPVEVFPRYYEEVRKLIRTGLFDILSHPDAIRKEFFQPAGSLDDEYKQVAELIRDEGMCIEMNTAGLRREAGFIYPHPDFLNICLDKGVPITIGSDAHRPEDVGRDFDRVMERLRGKDNVNIALYSRRKMEKIPLSELAWS